jgi:integrase
MRSTTALLTGRRPSCFLVLKLGPPNGSRKTYFVRGTDPVTHRRIDQTTKTADYKTAKLVLNKLNKDLLNGILSRKVASFPEMAVEYIEARDPGTCQREAIIGRENRDGAISPCLVSDFADVEDVRKIDQARVNEVIKRRFQINKHGKPYKAGTIVRELIQPLTCVLNHACKEDYCDKPRFTRPKYNDERLRYGTAEECARLLAASAPHVLPIWLFAMFIGDRIGESLDLQIRDVNLEKSWAVLRDTKNGKHRGIALHAQIVELLRVVIGDRTSGHVFLTDDGKPYKTLPKTAWNGACRRAGIEDFHIHDLRHTFGTNALVAGVPRRMQEQQMGHAAEGMYGRYAHVPDLELIEAINRLPWVMFEIPDYRTWARSGFGRIERTDNPAVVRSGRVA